MDFYTLTLVWRLSLILILAVVVFLQLVLMRKLQKIHRDCSVVRALLTVWAQQWNKPADDLMKALSHELDTFSKDCT